MQFLSKTAPTFLTGAAHITYGFDGSVIAQVIMFGQLSLFIFYFLVCALSIFSICRVTAAHNVDINSWNMANKIEVGAELELPYPYYHQMGQVCLLNHRETSVFFSLFKCTSVTSDMFRSTMRKGQNWSNSRAHHGAGSRGKMLKIFRQLKKTTCRHCVRGTLDHNVFQQD